MNTITGKVKRRASMGRCCPETQNDSPSKEKRPKTFQLVLGLVKPALKHYFFSSRDFEVLASQA